MLAQTFLYVWYFRYFLLRVLCRTVVQISTKKLLILSVCFLSYEAQHTLSLVNITNAVLVTKCRRSKRKQFQVFAELNANGTVHLNYYKNVYMCMYLFMTTKVFGNEICQTICRWAYYIGGVTKKSRHNWVKWHMCVDKVNSVSVQNLDHPSKQASNLFCETKHWALAEILIELINALRTTAQ